LVPDQWIDWCLTSSDVSKLSDAGQTVWGEYLIRDLHGYLDLQIAALEKCVHLGLCAEGMEKPISLLQDTVFQMKSLRDCSTWDQIVNHPKIEYGTIRFSKKCTDLELAERIKAIRNECKNGLGKKLKAFSESSEQVLLDLTRSSDSVAGLIALVKAFTDRYQRVKKARRIMDFGDLEHKLLDLLLGKSRSMPTALSREIGARFFEVMVDEYQDCNAVQDAIFDALTRVRQNCFMVGDVKQSIYQFRLAEPGIFVDKYNTYLPAETAEPMQGRKVQLSSNFRSSGGVISAVNDVFSCCMSPSVGGLHYGAEEALQEGVPHIALDEPEVELYGLCVKDDTYAEEASFVADKIKALLSGSHMVRDGQNLRPVTADDIVILLRSPGSVGGEFAFALESRGIRCAVGGSIDLLQTEEISFLVSILQIINNPLEDIPLIAVLTNRVFGFTADEIAQIRCVARNSPFYHAFCQANTEKTQAFCNLLDQLRNDARMLPLTQLMQKILQRTNLDSLYSALPDGPSRLDNIHYFCQLAADYEQTGQKDLYLFLDHIRALAERGLFNTNEPQSSDTVRIMSIHKSKGLEFPIVFLCGLSRGFNQESTRAQVLCDKVLGIGLSCVDHKNRVRYPSIAKRAIAVKMTADSISEEMRVLYVAMTRPKDRLIMTYAASNLDAQLQDIALRYDLSDPLLMTKYVGCPGDWVLQTAMQRTEAGEFFALGGRPDCVCVRDTPWKIQVVEAVENTAAAELTQIEQGGLSQKQLETLGRSLQFVYSGSRSSLVPSKITATQMKGRFIDLEVSEFTHNTTRGNHLFRNPDFVEKLKSGTDYGNAIHTLMHHIRFSLCQDISGIQKEIQRLVASHILTPEEGACIQTEQVYEFFHCEIGQRVVNAREVLREFKFSILQDACKYYPDVPGEKILVQGVVDCAIIDDDGITVIDFKSDHVTSLTLESVTNRYREQICVYVNALEEIYQKPIKAAYLYFFRMGKIVQIKG